MNLRMRWHSLVSPCRTVHPDLLTHVAAASITDDESFHTVCYMDLAMNPIPGEESAVDDFAMQLLKVLGYRSRERFLRSRKDIPLFICGTWSHVKTDVCVLNPDEILLLVQEDKRHLDLGDPRPQLIAEAIAAVQTNNRKREMVLTCLLLTTN